MPSHPHHHKTSSPDGNTTQATHRATENRCPRHTSPQNGKRCPRPKTSTGNAAGYAAVEPNRCNGTPAAASCPPTAAEQFSIDTMT
ncbi:hypothetical protein KRMM14A1259_41140 [Krasilnikovia sp. MM14-A1259]